MRFVSEHLPFYAVPTRYLAMDNFPMTMYAQDFNLLSNFVPNFRILTSNGKVDKQALCAVLTCGGHTAVEDS